MKNQKEKRGGDKNTAGNVERRTKIISPLGICADLIIISDINLIVLFLVYFQGFCYCKTIRDNT
jgi:hypothetical protein